MTDRNIFVCDYAKWQHEARKLLERINSHEYSQDMLANGFRTLSLYYLNMADTPQNTAFAAERLQFIGAMVERA